MCEDGAALQPAVPVQLEENAARFSCAHCMGCKVLLKPSSMHHEGAEGPRRVVEMPQSLQVTSKAWRGGCRPGGHAERPAKLCAAPSRVPFSRGHCVSVHSPPGHGGMSSPWLGQAWTSSLPGSPLPLLPDSPRLGVMESLGLVRGRRRRSPQRLANLDQTAGNPLLAVQEDLESAGPAGGRPRQTGSCLTGRPRAASRMGERRGAGTAKL